MERKDIEQVRKNVAYENGNSKTTLKEECTYLMHWLRAHCCMGQKYEWTEYEELENIQITQREWTRGLDKQTPTYVA